VTNHTINNNSSHNNTVTGEPTFLQNVNQIINRANMMKSKQAMLSFHQTPSRMDAQSRHTAPSPNSLLHDIAR
jgi:hypothetical protein